MKKMNSSTKQLILLIFNSVLTIATFVITYYIDPLKYTSQSSLAAVPAFLLSIIVLIIGQNITTHNEVQKVSNNYSDLEYDDEGNIIHGVWSGHSWMWLEGGMESINSTAYPEYTMSDAVCPASDFSIILSYDHSELKW